LIRYRVGDLAVLSAEPVACQQCPSPIVESIFGRTAQTLISRDGRRISNISVIAQRCHHVEAMQCVQEQPGMVTIRVLKGAEFTADDGREILRQFGLKMGQMDFDIEYVDRIERTASGKFLSIVSKIPPERLASEAGGLSCR
jgi:phenylacetate-coenzyme A ligase PaaK-like adenylate-forming protein